MIDNSLIVSLLLILTMAWSLGYLFSRLGLPMMLGQLMAGIILGPPLLGWVTATPSIELMADLGVFFVMFYTGMEMNPKELINHFRPALVAALGGFLLPFAFGFLVVKLFGGTILQALFVGMGISITAIAVGSVVLQSLRINQTELGQIIIGAAIIDDVLSLISLSILFGLARTGSISLGGSFLVMGKVMVFFGLALLVGQYIMPRIIDKVTDKEGFGFAFAITIALAMAYLAELAGLHIIIGAFVGGQMIRRDIMNEKLHDAIADRFYGIAYGFLMPIFFASLALHLHLKWSWNFFIFASAITAVAIAGKIIGSGLAIRLAGFTSKESLVVGFGMNGRGAVELVVASVVLELSRELLSNGTITDPLLTQVQFSALIIMAFLTTMMAPISLKWAVGNACQPGEYANFCRIMDETIQT